MGFFSILGLVIVCVITYVSLFVSCKQIWTMVLSVIGFGVGIFMFVGGCIDTGYDAGAKDMLRGKLEIHYIYEDSICIDTIIKQKENK